MKGENKVLQNDLSHKLKRILRKFNHKLDRIDIKKYFNNTDQYKICSGGYIWVTPKIGMRSKSNQRQKSSATPNRIKWSELRPWKCNPQLSYFDLCPKEDF